MATAIKKCECGADLMLTASGLTCTQCDARIKLFDGDRKTYPLRIETHEEADRKCKACDGKGHLVCDECDGYGEVECCECGHVDDCDECGATGEIECEECGGTGELQNDC